MMLPADAYEAFLCGTCSIIYKTAFCLEEKQDMLVNDDCSCWYNIVGDFLVSIWDRRKQLLYTDQAMDQHA